MDSATPSSIARQSYATNSKSSRPDTVSPPSPLTTSTVVAVFLGVCQGGGGSEEEGGTSAHSTLVLLAKE